MLKNHWLYFTSFHGKFQISEENFLGPFQILSLNPTYTLFNPLFPLTGVGEPSQYLPRRVPGWDAVGCPQVPDSRYQLWWSRDWWRWQAPTAHLHQRLLHRGRHQRAILQVSIYFVLFFYLFHRLFSFVTWTSESIWDVRNLSPFWSTSTTLTCICHNRLHVLEYKV